MMTFSRHVRCRADSLRLSTTFTTLMMSSRRDSSRDLKELLNGGPRCTGQRAGHGWVGTAVGQQMAGRLKGVGGPKKEVWRGGAGPPYLTLPDPQ